MPWTKCTSESESERTNKETNLLCLKKQQQQSNVQKCVKRTKTIFEKLRKALGNMSALTSEKGLVFLGSSRGTSEFDTNWSIWWFLRNKTCTRQCKPANTAANGWSGAQNLSRSEMPRFPVYTYDKKFVRKNTEYSSCAERKSSRSFISSDLYSTKKKVPVTVYVQHWKIFLSFKMMISETLNLHVMWLAKHMWI